VKIVVKKKLKGNKKLIAASFLISIIALVTPVTAYDTNGILIIAKGDDMDLTETTNLIIAKIDFDNDDGIPAAKVLFQSKISDESGKKVYEMKGMLKEGFLLTTEHYFYCPIFNIWWINVWWVMGEGRVKTSDTDIDVFFRNTLPITMPNTEGKYVSASILMYLSFTGEYCLEDPSTYPPGTYPPVFVMPEGGWALAAVIWEVETPIGPMVLPVGPVSYLTKYVEI